MRERIRLNVLGAMPVRLVVDTQGRLPVGVDPGTPGCLGSEVRSWVAQSMARTITVGGMEGRPILGAYSSAKSSSETLSCP
jgi:hypothetical protein